ncbi:hydrogen peroxide-inducible genes activator [Phaeobacter gallaeciensis]|uniref:Hydrogen peroxide-inducible genes activator OxyR n=1 Tax=Phaeobacter gallaeciensis TaxID=60890 RepID=A0AAC9ZCF8_9RHOB|nr:hydrogen peroxide-inducible genes activator [Phaeobacter gallaeciensis]AHD11984.1 Transcriptional regulator [Phaeobacter gallaeciensis DSM 26640]ATE95250.1 hydrogen peroxide-inducible genes activator OxyR [Phaeobacter gallaeciensis]ATE99641.1 hydrogen peroxide-inducible genes activator OxyR [Phaeobacter gallaeciensis]ATF03955.1 hydrogen peroxide-inducible genes activator OxyR [Phaeobacter gallaeciensis]ATF08231.1 hydrogen peroxide-inducible genes activator OxyR [Phaeobacter gallaeciensis]
MIDAPYNTSLTLRQLRFLVAVADELNFSRAAERCYVSQPTLSVGLRELEDRLGVTLAERTKRSVILTPVGAQIAERARKLLQDSREIEELAAAQASPEGGTLRMGAIPTIGPFLIPRAMPALKSSFPDLQLYLREEMTGQLLEGVQSGRLDLVIYAEPYAPAGLDTLHLFDDGYHLAAPPTDPTPPQVPGAAIRGADLDGRQLMLLEQGHCLHRHALSAFPERDIQQDESFAATSLSTLISMVSEGLGITLLPDLAIDAGVAAGQDVVMTPLADACPRRVTLAWRPTSVRADLFRKIGAVLRTARGSLVAP